MFCHAILGVGHFCPTVVRGAWTQLHQTWRGHRAIISYTRSLFLCSDILLHFQTQAAQSWVMLKMTPNFALF